MSGSRANTGETGMGRHLTDPPLSAQQSIQAQQSKAARDRESPAQVTSIGSKHGDELTRIARDPKVRQDFLTREKAEREQRDREREAARVKRAKEALEHRTEIADSNARGMARYATGTDTPS
ncbi:hypothetical protein BJD99_10530 [Rhodococcus sp. 1163]|uniref:hypothetical protein n=1 Tax=Rhodococcus sp. 1163 TaxID=1905289 RepID=UPI000A003957|nr:hypothetical protein [Rhodococcus sp. 1163]ORI16920.1 hypothetical protein BJD99_10530 [Rhodococcus sp. 1163]